MGKDLKGKELGKGISQRSDGYYIGRFTGHDGKRVQKVFPKLQECRKWLADSQYINEHNTIDAGGNMTVKSWFDYWISVKKRVVRPNTLRNYTERYNRNIHPVIGNELLQNVKPLQCQQIMNKMADEGYRSTTIYQARIALYNMFDYAYQNDVIIKNPCTKMVKSDIGKETKKKEALTLDVHKKFLDGICGYSYENQYRFILQTGLRTGEMVALKWSDIDFETKTLTVNKTMEYRYSVGEWRIGPPKSKSGNRTIPLTDEAIRILYDQKARNALLDIIPFEWHDIVFLCRNGTPVKNSTYDTGLFKACDRIGIPRFSMHVLRHTFATRCIEAGMKPKTLQSILGHSNIGITMNLYVHTTEDEKFKEISMIEQALNVV